MNKEIENIVKQSMAQDFQKLEDLKLDIDTDNEVALKMVNSWKEYFHPYEMFQFVEGHAGFDITPLKNDDILLLGLKTNLQQYASIYHSEKDIFELVDRRELALGAAASASMVYLIDKYASKLTGHNRR